MKPAGGYMSARLLGVLDHEGGARFVTAITIRIFALRDLSSMLIFVSPKASCESNTFNRVLGQHHSGGGGREGQQIHHGEDVSIVSNILGDASHGLGGEIVLNYSHSRNPPCAPARTHGRTQAPREPPN
jgi:hypothetical protein